MQHRFLKASAPEFKKAGPQSCLILSDEFIPGELLLSRARFRFNSPMQNSKRLTIFTTCQKKRPLTVHNCTKACTQLEKYLISLETNKLNVEKLIKEKISFKYGVKAKDINVVISKPKAKLIMGMTKPLLDKPSRHSDFQLQRHSFKNIEIITFDEIYSSLIEIKTELSKKLKRK